MTPPTFTSSSPTKAAPPLWDVFCRVIDNLGDIGVSWRFCADLAQRGQTVRLWIDDPAPLRWMAPGALEGRVAGIEVVHWTAPLDLHAQQRTMANVWVEAFACDPAPEWTAALKDHLNAGHAPPVWINLEYMSAEPYVERCHGLPSPFMSGPLSGQTKWFFYPGFTAATGGLLREQGLIERRNAFDAGHWLHAQGIHAPADSKMVSLFCYEPRVLGQVLREAAQDAQNSFWMITPGRAEKATSAAAAFIEPIEKAHPLPPTCLVPHLPQTEFDHLLWSSDLNFVRGEDSLVRALWAGQAFVWHIYPQEDDAHHAKLEAFLDWLQAPPSLRQFHRFWNGMCSPADKVWPGWSATEEWRACAVETRQRLLDQPDLTARLLDFVAKKR